MARNIGRDAARVVRDHKKAEEAEFSGMKGTVATVAETVLDLTESMKVLVEQLHDVQDRLKDCETVLESLRKALR